MQDETSGRSLAGVVAVVLAGAAVLAVLVGVVVSIGAVFDGSGSRAGGSSGCEASYPDDCLDSGVEDYDCEGGTGDGPRFVSGPVTVDRDVADPDPFDRDGDGVGCDS